MDWILAHKGELLSGLAMLWGLVTLVVGLTPSTQDDSALRRFAEKVALLWPSNSRQRNPFSLPGAALPRIEEEESIEIEIREFPALADELEPEDEVE